MQHPSGVHSSKTSRERVGEALLYAMMAAQVYSPSRPPPLSKNLPGELWQVGKTVTQGELEVVNPGYVFNTINSIPPGEGGKTVDALANTYCKSAARLDDEAISKSF